MERLEVVPRKRLTRISQEFQSRAGQVSVKHESAQFLSGDSVLRHIEVDKDEQTRSLPAIPSRSRNTLEKCRLSSRKCGEIGLGWPDLDLNLLLHGINLYFGRYRFCFFCVSRQI